MKFDPSILKPDWAMELARHNGKFITAAIPE
eukprot:CAMPEP_0201107542 /NCGR_PEP_ID=MMETSP0812-20130820/57132_1 /ASSEMBLY_ACC=CAM_ASM_000668 /TAXON_ID=98059 /ORGANISM="Dinobryon sp., Strain UTEXLB2267" /LENGTH=30 /DNA_ID= /DNA_START= /DNA_END= /DNA_ORIENTATION=